MAGAGALFDEAITNALAAIVASEWPGKDTTKSGDRVLSAASLLGVIQERCDAVSLGVYALPTLAYGNERVDVPVDAMMDAVGRAQASRHARAAKSDLTPDDVAALAALDDHPALRTLFDENIDEAWRRAKVLDRQIAEHASRYLELIGDEEASRRAEMVDEFMPSDPKERYDAVEPQDCPVCDYPTLIVEGVDEFGFTVGVGTCVVCSYYRSADIARDEAMQLAWEHRWSRY